MLLAWVMTLIRERNYERDESDDVRNILLISPKFLTELHALRATALYSGDGRLHALCVLMLRELEGPAEHVGVPHLTPPGLSHARRPRREG